MASHWSATRGAIASMSIPTAKEFNPVSVNRNFYNAENVSVEANMTDILLKYEEWNLQSNNVYV